MILSAGSIFEETSPLPAAPDVHVLSSSSTTNYGTATVMELGSSSSGGESEIYMNSIYLKPMAKCNDSNLNDSQDVQRKRCGNFIDNDFGTRLF